MNPAALKRQLQPLSHDIGDYPDGIVLVVDKPYRWTSADVVRKVKWLACRHFNKKNLKVGHAGTLDPLATGVLLVCIGNATKRAESLQARDKEYIAGISFGATTPSYDLEKEIDRRYGTDGICAEGVQKALKGFIGEQEQIAPLFSAKSIDGVRAYELARKLYKKQFSGQHDGMAEEMSAVPSSGLSAELSAGLPPDKNGEGHDELNRHVHTAEPVSHEASAFDESAAELIRSARIRIDALELLSYSGTGEMRFAPDFEPDYRGMSDEERLRAQEKNNRINVVDARSLGLPLAEVRIECSKGTYVRAFARDLGEALGSGAFLSYLIRSRNGIYSLDDALSLYEIQNILFA